MCCEHNCKTVFSFQVTIWDALVPVKRRKTHNLFSRKKQLAPVEALPRGLNLSKEWSFCGNLRYKILCHLLKRLQVVLVEDISKKFLLCLFYLKLNFIYMN